jgi:cell division cycle 2-like protein
MKDLICGLAYMHEMWYLHRDLKTANLLYTNNGCLKICDFGMARRFGYPLGNYTNLVVTQWYRAPEVILFFV